jgi:hypothetical protein
MYSDALGSLPFLQRVGPLIAGAVVAVEDVGVHHVAAQVEIESKV